MEGGLGKSCFDILSTIYEDANATDQLGDNDVPMQQNVITVGPTTIVRGKSNVQSIDDRSRCDTMIMGGRTDATKLSETHDLFTIGENTMEIGQGSSSSGLVSSQIVDPVAPHVATVEKLSRSPWL
ncbi:hypothetical protein V6N13_117137 [Hibiscus sabdariffa]|uniref:Uncharacterized protein n=1 Tax=Hibiscus sabdariffa TaxID=183260 RepID=A0ABR2QHZ3_9ROSI